MKVIFDSQVEKLVNESVESGKYDSPEVLVRDAVLALLKKDATLQTRIERLQKEVRSGLRDIDRGKVGEFNKDVIKQLGRHRLSSREA